MAHTPETKAKISKSKKGQRSSIATEFKKGVSTWNKGRAWSPEQKKKLSEARYRFYANGGKHPLEGKKRPDMTGKNNPNFGKFGINHPKYVEVKNRPFHRAIRETYKYKEWRNAIFTRDNFTCVLCGENGELNADHYPKRFIDIINELEPDTVEDTLECEELWDIKNGRTLCIKCHRNTPTWGRRIENQR